MSGAHCVRGQGKGADVQSCCCLITMLAALVGDTEGDMLLWLMVGVNRKELHFECKGLFPCGWCKRRCWATRCVTCCCSRNNLKDSFPTSPC